jgi:hypothetical protein
MTMYADTASPGRRWKMFLPEAVSMPSGVLSMSTASALIRNRWLSADARRSERQTIAGSPRPNIRALVPVTTARVRLRA